MHQSPAPARSSCAKPAPSIGNKFNSYSASNVTAVPDDDGIVTLNLAPADEGLGNHLNIMDGWNDAFRVYRPRKEVFDGTWTPPTPVLAE